MLSAVTVDDPDAVDAIDVDVSDSLVIDELLKLGKTEDRVEDSSVQTVGKTL